MEETMIKRRPLRFRHGWAWLMSLAGVALILVAGVFLTDRDDPERAGRSVSTPTKSDAAPNFKIIDKEQRIDVDTFDQKDSPLWPLFEELRSAVPRNSSTATDPS
ncbi:hypothetical protein [Spongiactinospora rosea]|uniref:hypothetical protein n=1 Tax=Spongiactinospora rosea TaxID=2248750 RepID=UPI0011C02C92|nr:hypothetical protein [Spongiactinospora rosea]